jgi:hypothetical protein
MSFRWGPPLCATHSHLRISNMDPLQATPADRLDQTIDGRDLPVDLRDEHLFRPELCRFSMPTNPHPVERQIICLRLPHRKQNCSNNLYVRKDSTDKWGSGICYSYQPSTNGRKVFSIMFLPFREYHDQQQASTETTKRVHNGVSISSMHAPAVHNPGIGLGPLDTGRFKTKESCYVDFRPPLRRERLILSGMHRYTILSIMNGLELGQLTCLCSGIGSKNLEVITGFRKYQPRSTNS